MTIKHLVFSSGGCNGINMVGVLTKLYEKKFFIRKNIESVYGTSAGAMVLAIWLMDIDKETLYDYIIKRPWHKIYTIKINMIFDLISDKGILDKKFFIDLFSPLLKSKGLTKDITLKEFNIFTEKEYNIFITKVNNLKSIKINHHTHPNLKLIDAIYMSSSIPLIFKPEFFEDSYIIDGAIGAFYPIKPCLDDGALKDEILGVKITRPTIYAIREDDTFLKYISSMLNNLTRISSDNVSSKNEEMGIPNLIVCTVLEADDLELIITTGEKREELLKSGELLAEEFLKSRMKEL